MLTGIICNTIEVLKIFISEGLLNIDLIDSVLFFGVNILTREWDANLNNNAI